MIAVIRTGGKQYVVSPGQKIKVEKLNLSAQAGKKEGLAEAPASSRASDKASASEVTFNEVLLLEKNKKVEIGTPTIKGLKVLGKVLKQGKGKKQIIFKYKAKKRYKVKRGHRQPFTEIEITKILLA